MAAVTAVLVLVVFQCAILEHNLRPWREAAAEVRAVCTSFGREIAGASGAAVVHELPATRNGAVFLHNGFPQCVELNSGVPAWRIQVMDSADPGGGAMEFRWNETAERLERSPNPIASGHGSVAGYLPGGPLR